MWKENELEYLIVNFEIKSKEEILNNISKSWDSIRKKSNKLGLYHNDNWKENEVNYLKQNYARLSIEEILNRLKGRTWKAIKIFASRNNLKRNDEEYFSKLFERKLLN
jgi:hypothetical protein